MTVVLRGELLPHLKYGGDICLHEFANEVGPTDEPEADAGGKEEEGVASEPPDVEFEVVAEVQKEKASQNREECRPYVAHLSGGPSVRSS